MNDRASSLMRVVVGSGSPIKIDAVSTAVSRVFGSSGTVCAVDTDSGVAEQPWGNELTRTGAENRARAALHAQSSHVGVGIEAGLVELGDSSIESVSWAVAIGASRDGSLRRGQSRAASYLLPFELAELVRRGLTLGAATRQLFESRPESGTIGPRTGGIFDRRVHYVEAVMLALIPFYPSNADLTFATAKGN